jgi:hypothetical protein
MAMALSFQDNTAAQAGSKDGGEFLWENRQQKKERSPRVALFSK